MNRRTVWPLLVVGAWSLGCGERPGPSDGEAQDSEVDAARSGPIVVEPLPDMPPFPAPRRGFLVVTSAGSHVIEGAWQARAGICEDPPMLTVLAEEPGVGVLVLLQLPPAGQRITRYPITIVHGDGRFPTPPAAQLAIQLLTDRNVYGFQGDTGQVEIYGFGELLDRIDPRERAVSGRFAVTAREIQSEQRVQVAGAFDGVGVTPLPADQCRQAREAAAPDTAAAR